MQYFEHFFQTKQRSLECVEYACRIFLHIQILIRRIWIFVSPPFWCSLLLQKHYLTQNVRGVF